MIAAEKIIRFSIGTVILFSSLNKNKSIVTNIKIFGSGALSGKMLLVRIISNNKIDNYFRPGYVK